MGRKPKGRVGRPSTDSAGEVEARLLSAAADSFLRHGYDGTTLEGVAKAAGASKATLYSRYAGKAELFSAMIRANVDAALLPVAEVPADLPLRERVHRAGRSVIGQAMQPVPLSLMRLFIAEAPRHRALIREADDLARREGIRSIAEAIAGSGRDDPQTMARADSAAARFIELAFVPHQMHALLCDDAAELDAALDDRIAFTLDALEATGLIP